MGNSADNAKTVADLYYKGEQTREKWLENRRADELYSADLAAAEALAADYAERGIAEDLAAAMTRQAFLGGGNINQRSAAMGEIMGLPMLLSDDPREIRRGHNVQGRMPNQNFAGTPEEAAAIRGEGYTQAMARALATQGMRNDAAMARHRITTSKPLNPADVGVTEQKMILEGVSRFLGENLGGTFNDDTERWEIPGVSEADLLAVAGLIERDAQNRIPIHESMAKYFPDLIKNVEVQDQLGWMGKTWNSIMPDLDILQVEPGAPTVRPQFAGVPQRAPLAGTPGTPAGPVFPPGSKPSSDGFIYSPDGRVFNQQGVQVDVWER